MVILLSRFTHEETVNTEKLSMAVSGELGFELRKTGSRALSPIEKIIKKQLIRMLMIFCH